MPIWISDYVIGDYGTGAVMAVPCGDQRDFEFANFFKIKIINIFDGIDVSEKAYTQKDSVKLKNSFFFPDVELKPISWVYKIMI